MNKAQLFFKWFFVVIVLAITIVFSLNLFESYYIDKKISNLVEKSNSLYDLKFIKKDNGLFFHSGTVAIKLKNITNTDQNSFVVNYLIKNSWDSLLTGDFNIDGNLTIDNSLLDKIGLPKPTREHLIFKGGINSFSQLNLNVDIDDINIDSANFDNSITLPNGNFKVVVSKHVGNLNYNLVSKVFLYNFDNQDIFLKIQNDSKVYFLNLEKSFAKIKIDRLQNLSLKNFNVDMEYGFKQFTTDKPPVQIQNFKSLIKLHLLNSFLNLEAEVNPFKFNINDHGSSIGFSVNVKNLFIKPFEFVKYINKYELLKREDLEKISNNLLTDIKFLFMSGFDIKFNDVLYRDSTITVRVNDTFFESQKSSSDYSLSKNISAETTTIISGQQSSIVLNYIKEVFGIDDVVYDQAIEGYKIKLSYKNGLVQLNNATSANILTEAIVEIINFIDQELGFVQKVKTTESPEIKEAEQKTIYIKEYDPLKFIESNHKNASTH